MRAASGGRFRRRGTALRYRAVRITSQALIGDKRRGQELSQRVEHCHETTFALANVDRLASIHRRLSGLSVFKQVSAPIGAVDGCTW